MGVVTVGTFTSDTETVTRTKLNNLAANLVTEFNGNIDNANCRPVQVAQYMLMIRSFFGKEQRNCNEEALAQHMCSRDKDVDISNTHDAHFNGVRQ